MAANTYDAVLKSILQTLAGRLVPDLAGARPVESLNVELPAVEKRFCDLLLRLDDSRVFHLELQTYNDPFMADRMLLYRALLKRIRPKARVLQCVVYCGNPRMRMPGGIEEPGLEYHFLLYDIRELDGELFLASPDPAERVLGLLCRNPDPDETIRRILLSWKHLGANEVGDLGEKLVILSGLRGLRTRVKEAIRTMAVDLDRLIRENEWFQEWKKEGLAEGRAEGRAQGRAEGRAEGKAQGAAQMLRRRLERRFGQLPEWANKKITSATFEDLERWDDRTDSAGTLRSVFR